MSAETEDSGDKPYEATERKLEQARKQGQFAFSADLVTAAAYAGFTGYAALLGGGALVAAGGVLQTLLAEGLRTGPEGGDTLVQMRAAIAGLAGPLAGWFVVPAGLAALAVIAQGGPVFAPPRMAPAWHKISPLSAIKQRLGVGGLVEFLKGLVKSTLFAVVLGFYLVDALPGIVAAVALDARQVSVLMIRSAVDVALLALAVALVVGIFDLIWQRIHHLMEQRMSRRELEDELRESDGDPMLKSQRRQAAISIAMNQASAAVPKADVVIVNPTHFAVALSWDRGGGRAPVCVAKGVDQTALHIRRLAMASGVPIRSDPPTARALHAAVDVGREVPRAHFRAVAAAIRFADRVRQAKPGSRGGPK
jgi:flagellar biosynthetic protein FlhB